jgi:hypothetical protein
MRERSFLWKKQKLINGGNFVPESPKGKQYRRRIRLGREEKGE